MMMIKRVRAGSSKQFSRSLSILFIFEEDEAEEFKNYHLFIPVSSSE
jgi:hypothetical protein